MACIVHVETDGEICARAGEDYGTKIGVVGYLVEELPEVLPHAFGEGVVSFGAVDEDLDYVW